jgi:hypothetical protein
MKTWLPCVENLDSSLEQSLCLFIGLLHIPRLHLNHLTQSRNGPSWVLNTGRPWSLHKEASPWCNLSHDTTCPPEILHQVLRLKPGKPTTRGLKAAEVTDLLHLLHHLDVSYHLSSIAWSPSPHAPTLPWSTILTSVNKVYASSTFTLNGNIAKC